VAISGSGFDPNTSYTVSCRSTRAGDNPWSTFTLRTNGNGFLGTSSTCYYGYPGEQVWATVGSVSSSRMTW
jgi:hypothetical protein